MANQTHLTHLKHQKVSQPTSVFILLCLLFVLPQTMGSGNKLTFTHGLIKQRNIIRIGESVPKNTYISLQRPFEVLDTLQNHLSVIISALEDDLQHLSASTLTSFTYKDRYFTFGQNVLSPNRNKGCKLIGQEPVEFGSKEELEGIAEAVKNFNQGNEGVTEIQPVTQFMIPVLTDGTQLKYPSGKTLDIQASTSQKLDATSITPVIYVANKTIHFRNADTKVPILCEIAGTDKRKHRGTWKTFALRRKTWAKEIQTQVQKTKTLLNSVLATSTPFKYTHGVAQTFKVNQALGMIQTMKRELSGHAAVNIHDQSLFALATVYIQNYLDKLNKIAKHVSDQFGDEKSIKTKLLAFALEELVQNLRQQVQNKTMMTTFTLALKNTLKTTKIYYDQGRRMVLLQIVGYVPQESDLMTSYRMLSLPFPTATSEVTLNTPSKHLIVDNSYTRCLFLDLNYFSTYCHKLNPDVYTCTDSQLSTQDECCSNIANLNSQEAISTCGVTHPSERPTLEHFLYPPYNFLWISPRLLKPVIIIFLCNNVRSERQFNESALISTNCAVEYNAKVFTSSKPTVTGVTIRLISDVFLTLMEEILSIKVEPTKNRDTEEQGSIITIPALPTGHSITTYLVWSSIGLIGIATCAVSVASLTHLFRKSTARAVADRILLESNSRAPNIYRPPRPPPPSAPCYKYI